MKWYYAKDGQQMGPIEESELSSLVASRTIGATTLVWREGMPQWQPYQEVWQAGMPDWRLDAPSTSAPSAPAESPAEASSSSSPDVAPGTAVCAECRQAFPADQLSAVGGKSVCPVCRPTVLQRQQAEFARSGGPVGLPPLDPDALVEAASRGPGVEVMDCFRRSLDLLKREPMLCIGSVAIAGFLVFASGLIPVISLCISLLVNTPLLAGIWIVFIKSLRTQPTTLEDVFAGFTSRWLPLVGLGLVQMLVVMGAMVPFAAVVAGWALVTGQRGMPPMGVGVILPGLIALVGFALIIYVQVAMFLSVPLMIDRGFGVMDSLNTSRRIVNRHLGPTLLMMILSFLLTVGGALALCVGLLVAAPLVSGMWAAAYEDLCGSGVNRPISG